MNFIKRNFSRNIGIASSFTILYIYFSSAVLATVIEFDSDGKAIFTEKKREVTAPISTQAVSHSSDAGRLQDLTRTVAVRYSGEPGVRKAGLNALSFIRIFEALILAESNFDPKAVSPKGAQGLGQLMPDTASDLNVSDPFDPHQNLIGSAQYFTKLLQQYGSLELALAAYNAGPNRVKKYGGVPPFAETKNYISKILLNAGVADQRPQQVPANAAVRKQNSKPVNSEKPLEGETSVWEF